MINRVFYEFNSLSQAELNFLLRRLAYVSHDQQEVSVRIKQQANHLYKLADKETEVGRAAFNLMNALRNKHREIKDEGKRTSDIIRKLKAQRKYSV